MLQFEDYVTPSKEKEHQDRALYDIENQIMLCFATIPNVIRLILLIFLRRNRYHNTICSKTKQKKNNQSSVPYFGVAKESTSAFTVNEAK